ncbi:MAG: hypothetical protein II894_03620, partial [Bacteroidales bacterium]|nr:hypothetical protein [Bacteroidales bacterium]
LSCNKEIGFFFQNHGKAGMFLPKNQHANQERNYTQVFNYQYIMQKKKKAIKKAEKTIYLPS